MEVKNEKNVDTEKSNTGTIILVLLIGAVILAIIGVAIYLYYTNRKKNDNNDNTPPSTPILHYSIATNKNILLYVLLYQNYDEISAIDVEISTNSDFTDAAKVNNSSNLQLITISTDTYSDFKTNTDYYLRVKVTNNNNQSSNYAIIKATYYEPFSNPMDNVPSSLQNVGGNSLKITTNSNNNPSTYPNINIFIYDYEELNTKFKNMFLLTQNNNVSNNEVIVSFVNTHMISGSKYGIIVSFVNTNNQMAGITFYQPTNITAFDYVS